MDKKREMIWERRLKLSYTVQLVMDNIFIKSQNPSYSDSWEISDNIYNVREIVEKERMIKQKEW